MTASDAAFIANELRQHARDHYLASLYAPESARPHVQALYGFDLELARIPRQVSEAAMGEIRLQWWLDTLDAMAAHSPPAHPVGRALRLATLEAALPLAPLRRMVEARRTELYADPLPDMAALEQHLGETTSAPIQLAALILAGPAAAAAAKAAGLAGVALGIARLLGSLPSQEAHGFALIPDSLLPGAGPTRSELARDPGASAAVIAALVAQAELRLAEARAAFGAVPAAARPAFLPVGVARPWLRRVASAGGAAFAGSPRFSALARQWAIWRAARNNSF